MFSFSGAKTSAIRAVIALALLCVAPFSMATDCNTAADIDNLPPGHWCRVPNSHMEDQAPNPLPPGTIEMVMRAWNGGAYDTIRDRLIVWGGGHADYAGNEIYVFDMNTLEWSRVTDPSLNNLTAVGPEGDEVYLDGLPRSRHIYNHVQFLPNVDLFVIPGGCCMYPGLFRSSQEMSTYDFNQSGNAGWESNVRARRPSGGITTSMVSAYDPITGKMWMHTMLNGGRLLSYDPVADSWDTHANKQLAYYMTADVDAARHRMVLTGKNGKTYYYDLDNPDNSIVQVSTSGDRAMENAQAPGFVYDPASDQFVAWSGGSSVYTLNPETWRWTRVTPADGNSTTPTSAEPLGTYGRWRYVPSKNVFVGVNRTDQDVYIYRLTSGGGTSAPSGNITASPSTIQEGQSSTLNWSFSDADSCVASGAWSGNRPASGDQTVSPNSTAEYIIQCSNSDGSVTRSATVDVVPQAPPQVNLTASATTVGPGGTVVLTWTTVGADSCTASGGWSGSRPTSGSETSPSLQSNTTFTLACSNSSGSSSDSVTVSIAQPPDFDVLFRTESGQTQTPMQLDGQTVSGTIYAFADPAESISSVEFFLNGNSYPPEEFVAPYDLGGGSGVDTEDLPNGANTLRAEISLPGGGNVNVNISFNVSNTTTFPVPAVDFSASNVSIPYGAFTTLQWSSTDATGCNAGGGWSGSRGISGSESVGPLFEDTSFFLTCTGPGGSDTETVAILVDDPAPPTLTISASPGSVPFQGASRIDWNTTNADSCQASGDWSGNRNTSGSENVGPLTANSTYTLTCSGPGGDIQRSASVQVAAAPSPTVSISANPNPTDFNSATTLNWSSSNATSCTATGAWSGSRSTSGSLTVGPLTSDQTYGLSCTGAGGTASDSVDVVVNAAPSPTLTLSVSPQSIDFGDTTSISWSSQNTTSCTATGGWSGQRGTSGTETSSPLTSSTTFTLECVGPGGSITRNATVTVGSAPAPDVTLTAAPSNVAFNGASTLTWTSANATSCVASGGWSGGVSLSGSRTVGPLTADTTFTLTCSGNGQDTQRNVTVTVDDEPPTLTFSAQPDALPFNGTTTLTWSSSNASSCEAFGDWTGSRPTSGSEVSAALTADATFRLVCTGSGGSADITRNVTVADASAPSLSLQANPLVVTAGGNSSLSWSAADVDTCTASGGWTGTRPLSGNESVGPINSETSYTLSCTGPGGTIDRSVTVAIAPNAPTVAINATPSGASFGGSVVIGWSSTDATSCQAFGGWSGTKATSGGEQIDNLQADTEFRLVCSGPGGEGSNAVTVTVDTAPEPVIDLTASPSSIGPGASTTLTWSVDNALSCTAAGGWSGSRGLSGSETVGPLSLDTSFSLACSGAGGQSVETVLVTVSNDAPVLSIGASPANVGFGGSTVVTWTTTGATSCEAFGDWSGSQPTSGSSTQSNLTGDSEFALLCTGPGGTVTDSALVSVSAAPEPTVNLSTNPSTVDFEGTATLTWSTQNADSCTAFGSWSGSRPVSGSEQVGPLVNSANYILVCEGPGGSTVASEQVTVTTPDLPQITLDVTPQEVVFGGSVQVSWSTQFATSCTASGADGFDGPVAVQGSESFGPLNATTSFSLVCSGPGGNASESVAVQVGRTADLPLQTFENDALALPPNGWFQTAANHSLAFNAPNFVVDEVNANNVLTLTDTGSNFHAHYLLNQGNLWTDYRYTGRMYVADVRDRTGVTVMSDYPRTDSYYALQYPGTGNFALTSRGTACDGSLDSGVRPVSGSWYRFSIEAENSAGDTTIRSKVWLDGANEPANWQSQCTDGTATRRLSGSVGVIGARVNNTRRALFDDLRVVPIDSQVLPTPRITLSATPTLVGVGGSSTLSWSSSDATSCEAAGGWSGVRGTSGSESVGPLNTDTSFTLVCEGPGGSTSRSLAIAVIDSSNAPTVSLTADPDEVPTGGSTTLSWSSTNAAVCIASGDWSGSKSLTGSEVINNIQKDTRYQLNCVGPGGNTADTVQVFLNDIPRDPTLVFDVDYTMLSIDSTVNLSWEARFVDSCNASGDWGGLKPTSGQEQVGPIEVSASYTLTCNGSNGPVSVTRDITYEDSDADGMPDVWELQFFGNLNNNGLGDSDGDGLTDRQEFAFGTDPFDVDTDGDGDSDFDEVENGSNPRDPLSTIGNDRPRTPELTNETGLPLWGFTADAQNGYNDPNGDALAESHWEFSLNSSFESLVFSRAVEGATSVMVPAGVFDPGISYYVRTRHTDASGATSPWSTTVTMRANTNYPNDADNNGIDDDYQTPPDADSNGNGTPDIDEGLCTLYDADGRSLVGFQTNVGIIRCYRSVPSSDLPQDSDVEGETPFGAFSFRVEGLAVNPSSPARAFVTVWLPEELAANSGWVLYDPTTQELLDFSDNVTFNDNRAIIEYVDGGFGDKDGIVNGFIVDPSGPLIVADTTPPPVTPPPGGGNPPTEESGGGGGGSPAPASLALLAGLAALRRRHIARVR